MNAPRSAITILIADDDDDDRQLAREAFHEARLGNPLAFVEDGEQLLAYLRREGRYADDALYPLPGLVLLDLNMPRMDGREALAEIKGSDQLKHIPVVVMTTSKAEEDVVRSYRVGVNSFITKPVTFQGLVEVVATLGKYWLEIVDLPGGAAKDA